MSSIKKTKMCHVHTFTLHFERFGAHASFQRRKNIGN